MIEFGPRVPDRRLKLNPFDSRLQSVGKAPKLRFKPGQIVKFGQKPKKAGDPNGGYWEIVYVFRLIGNPSEWVFECEWRASLVKVEPNHAFGVMAEVLGLGSLTPRVVYEPFRNEMDAFAYFADIPIVGQGRWRFGNTLMLRWKAEVVASGSLQ